ncbi:MAG: undecaprenyl-diphosphate phosphatase, partial [Acidimicrobiaceae bacterium]|nr:undecaprenyl-diphosphate phosphatase [Acidimicrobiaceae bacterium]
MLTHLATLASASSPHPISYGQATILGIIQGIAEPFPISSLGQTVLWPSLFGWQPVVRAQSNPESWYLAFVVALHVGNAVALVLYFLRDWVVIVKAWFRSIARRRIETPTERLAWLIVVASIPAGILGLLLEHPLRVALAKPLSAAIFLMLNGVMLFGAERLRKRDEVRQAAAALAV